MGRSHAKTLVWFATFTKLLPILLGVSSLLIGSAWTREFIPDWIGPMQLLYGLTFLYAGLVLVAVEAPFALPEAGKSHAGKFGAVLLVGLGIGSFIFSGLIFFNVYDPTTDESTVNTIFSILLLIMVGMFFFHAREELLHHKRLSYHAKLKGVVG